MANRFGTTSPDNLNGTGGNDSILGCAPDVTAQSPDPVTDSDTLSGHAGNDTLYGQNGDDLAYGGRGDDLLSGGYGHDVLFGGSGNDDLTLSGGSGQAYGGKGDDGFGMAAPGAGPGTVLDGGQGIDTLTVTLGARGSTALFSMPDAGIGTTLQDGSHMIGIERLIAYGFQDLCTLIGGAFDDILQTSGARSVLVGGGGDDRLMSYDANDATLFGGRGDDQIWVNDSTQTPGPHLADGGSGIDEINLYLAGATQGWDISLKGGMTILPDQIVLIGFERFNLIATSFDDTLSGSTNRDVLSGAGGNDVLRGCGGCDRLGGDAGADTLFGGAGSDTLTGYAGADQLFGGQGSDRLYLQNGATATGGQGADLFEFTDLATPDSAPTITDFSANDTILLNPFHFDALPLAHLRAQNFVAGSAAQDASDRILYDIATGSLWYDPDGNGTLTAEFFGHLTPGTTLTARDFLIL